MAPFKIGSSILQSNSLSSSTTKLWKVRRPSDDPMYFTNLFREWYSSAIKELENLEKLSLIPLAAEFAENEGLIAKKDSVLVSLSISNPKVNLTCFC